MAMKRLQERNDLYALSSGDPIPVRVIPGQKPVVMAYGGIEGPYHLAITEGENPNSCKTYRFNAHKVGFRNNAVIFDSEGWQVEPSTIGENNFAHGRKLLDDLAERMMD